MLTARVHLDTVTDENGPLKVMPGSHRFGKSLGDDAGAVPQAIFAQRGDVLLMRPPLVHASGKSQVPTKRHRRVLHLEFAAVRDLTDGFAWRDFVPARRSRCATCPFQSSRSNSRSICRAGGGPALWTNVNVPSRRIEK